VTDLAADTLDEPALRPREGSDHDGVRDVPANVRFLTTPAAAKYCGFRSCSGLRKASYRGLVKPAGRRGRTGPFVWPWRSWIDSWGAMMMAKKWVKRWGYEVSEKPVRPGV
jgi:hypothetical protein